MYRNNVKTEENRRGKEQKRVSDLKIFQMALKPAMSCNRLAVNLNRFSKLLISALRRVIGALIQ